DVELPLTPARPCRHQFLCRVSSGVGVLAVGGVVAEGRTGQDTTKRWSTHLEREGDASGGIASGTGETWDDVTGRGLGSDAGSSLSALIFVPCFFRRGCAGSGRGGHRSQD